MNALSRITEHRFTLAQAFWIGAGCIVATLIVGFAFAGWTTASKAAQQVADAEQRSRQALAAAVCEKRLLSASDSGARLQKLASMPWYERDEIILEGGYATMPDRTEASEAVAMQCATRLEKRLEEAKAKPATTPVSAAN
jgi:Flp pilus assembly protein TadB